MAIFTIVIGGSLSMFTVMQSELKLISQKQELVELKSYLMTTFTNSNNCTCNLRPADPTSPGGKFFDSTKTDGSAKMVLQTISDGCGAGAPLIAEVGKPLHDSFNGLKVAKIEFSDIKKSGALGRFDGNG